jgi:hypothetical protein
MIDNIKPYPSYIPRDRAEEIVSKWDKVLGVIGRVGGRMFIEGEEDEYHTARYEAGEITKEELMLELL